MIKFIIILFIIAYLFSPFLRCFLHNIFRSIFYLCKDTFEYIYYKKWQEFTWFGIYNFCGMFGKGKSLSCVDYTCRIYRRMQKYGKNVRIISNIDLKDVPYIPLVNFQQVVQIAEDTINGNDNGYCGTILVIDEIENILSHRKYASFPMEIMHTLTQQRKAKLVCFTTLQRWHMCDKCWRDISTWCVQCWKIWRFQRLKFYDGWDIENAINTDLVRCKRTEWFYVKDSTYNQYDTSSMVTKNSAEDFISNDELLGRRGLDLMSNVEGIKHPSKRVVKQRKMKVKK